MPTFPAKWPAPNEPVEVDEPLIACVEVTCAILSELTLNIIFLPVPVISLVWSSVSLVNTLLLVPPLSFIFRVLLLLITISELKTDNVEPSNVKLEESLNWPAVPAVGILLAVKSDAITEPNEPVEVAEPLMFPPSVRVPFNPW